MPAKSRWLLQIPRIIEQLSVLDVPIVDRAICQALFGVGRRRAIDLVQRFGGYQSGNAGLVDRLALIEQLKAMAESDDVRRERRRKQALAAELNKLERFRTAASVQIPVTPDVWERCLPELPAGVSLQSGQLIVRFTGTEELLERLFALAQAAANDYVSFRDTIEAAVPVS